MLYVLLSQQDHDEENAIVGGLTDWHIQANARASPHNPWILRNQNTFMTGEMA